MDLNDIKETLFDEKAIMKRVEELATKINQDYRESERGLVVVCVLKGAALFFAELVKRLAVPAGVELDFMALSSYGSGSKSRGTVRIIMDVRSDLFERDVLIVEDVVDSGLTLKYLYMLLGAHKPRSLETCVMCRKTKHNAPDAPQPRYVAFDDVDGFLVGMGLDYAERYRNLPLIGVLKEEVYMKK